MTTPRWRLFLATAGFLFWCYAKMAAYAQQPLYCTSYGTPGHGEYDPVRARTVYRINGAGTVTSFAVLAAGSSVSGLAVDVRGNIYTATRDQIIKITPDAKTSVFATLPESYVERLAFDRRGNLFAAGGTDVLKISPAGKVRHFATVLTG